MTPLLVHRPHWTQYEWGHSHHASGLVCRATTSCYIVQANCYECEFALKWQSLQRQHKQAAVVPGLARGAGADVAHLPAGQALFLDTCCSSYLLLPLLCDVAHA